MKFLKALAPILATVGAINWGLVGAAKFNAVEKATGRRSNATRWIYGLVGTAGLYMLATIRKQVREETRPAMPA